MRELHEIEKQAQRMADRIRAREGGPVFMHITADSAEGRVSRLIVSMSPEDREKWYDLCGEIVAAHKIEKPKQLRPPESSDALDESVVRIVTLLQLKFEKAGGPVRIPKFGSGAFMAELQQDGVSVDDLGSQSFLPWAVFEETIEILVRNRRRVAMEHALRARPGEERPPLDSEAGHLAHAFFGKRPGDSVLRRNTPVACILIWAGFCERASGELVLKSSRSPSVDTAQGGL